MDALKALAVLTGPLWLILILLGISIWIAIAISKKFKKRKIAGILIFFLVFFVPFGDEIAGRIYLASLCATKGGYELLGEIELPGEYWDEQGNPKFFDKRGHLDNKVFRKYIDETDWELVRYSKFLSIDKSIFITKDKATMTKLAQTTTYSFWGGWLRKTLSPQNSATTCGFLDSKGYTNHIYRKIFVFKKKPGSDPSFL